MSLPKTVKEIEAIYTEDCSLPKIDPEVSNAALKLLTDIGAKAVSKCIDVAIHSEDAYPTVGIVMRHHDDFRRILRMDRVVVGPCFEDSEDGERSLVPNGVAFWQLPEGQESAS